MQLQMIFFTPVLSLFIVQGAIAQGAARVLPQDIKQLTGCWQGTLNYSGTLVRKPYSATATLLVAETSGKDQLKLVHIYTKDSSDQTVDTLTIAAGGKMINGARVISKRTLNNGVVKIITEAAGFDRELNKNARIKHEYELGENAWSVKKLIRLEAQTGWQERTEFKYARKNCEGN
jgi:hypothetical protein